MTCVCMSDHTLVWRDLRLLAAKGGGGKGGSKSVVCRGAGAFNIKSVVRVVPGEHPTAMVLVYIHGHCEGRSWRGEGLCLHVLRYVLRSALQAGSRCNKKPYICRDDDGVSDHLSRGHQMNINHHGRRWRRAAALPSGSSSSHCHALVPLTTFIILFFSFLVHDVTIGTNTHCIPTHALFNSLACGLHNSRHGRAAPATLDILPLAIARWFKPLDSTSHSRKRQAPSGEQSIAAPTLPYRSW